MGNSERKCDACAAPCCTVMAVEELGKPAGVHCSHLASDGRCAIYAERPKSCVEWECLWLRGEGVLRYMERPDKSGVLFDVTGVPQALIAHEARPGAFKEDAARKLLARFQKKCLVILAYPDERILTGPPELIKLARRGK